MRKNTAWILAVVAGLSSLSAFGCNQQPNAPQYEVAQLRLSGFWSPYEQTEESYMLYKNAGLNTLLMGNHSVSEWTSETLDYLGSAHTQKSLELCRKVGLDAVLQYGRWYCERSEGKEMEKTPFSSRDLYEEYKDIIAAVHITDEPSVDAMDIYGDDVLTADYKSVYNVPYMVNLFPNYASKTQLGARSYDDYLSAYEEKILSDFPENAMVSVDFYPYRADADGLHSSWLLCYEKVAKLAQEYNATTHFYLQSANKNEFKDELTEKDMRLQAYVALCYGGRWLSYYCYAMPYVYAEDGSYTGMYEKCILDVNNKPTSLYDAVKNVNAEIQSFASAYLAYDWVKTVGLTDNSKNNGNLAINMLWEEVDFSDRKTVSDVTADGDCIVGCFERAEDEGYMLVNYSFPSENKERTVTLTLKKQYKYVAIYGGEGVTSGLSQIVKADRKGRCKITLKAGEGKFVVPLQ